jgi:hypothetical protein
VQSRSYTCGTGQPDQEQFYLNSDVEGRIEMLDTTTNTAYSLSTNPHFAGAYVISHPPDDWSNFKLEQGTGVFGDQVRIRNAFNNQCLRNKGDAYPVFSICEAWNMDQVGSDRLTGFGSY